MRMSLQQSTRATRASWSRLGVWAGWVLLALVSMNPSAWAEDTPGATSDPAAAPAKEGDGPWSGNVSLGYLATTGNTETTNANFGFEVDYAINRWTHGLKGSAIGASDDNDTTSEAYSVSWKSLYDLSERNYLFGRARWLKDRFSSYDQQVSEAVGYGRRLILQPHQNLTVEIGPGARQSELQDGEELNETILWLGASYEYQFNESAQLNFDLGVQAGEDNTFTEGILGLKTKLVGALAAVLAYTVRSNTDVLDDSEKTDTITSISLEYSF